MHQCKQQNKTRLKGCCPKPSLEFWEIFDQMEIMTCPSRTIPLETLRCKYFCEEVNKTENIGPIANIRKRPLINYTFNTISLDGHWIRPDGFKCLLVWLQGLQHKRKHFDVDFFFFSKHPTWSLKPPLMYHYWRIGKNETKICTQGKNVKF